MYINLPPTTTLNASAGTLSYNYNLFASLDGTAGWNLPQADPVESVIIEPILLSEINRLDDNARTLLSKTTGATVPAAALALYIPKQKADWTDVALCDANGEEIAFQFDSTHNWLWITAEACYPLEFAYKALPVYQPSTWVQDPWNTQVYGPNSGYLPYTSGHPGTIFVGTGTPINAPTAGGFVPSSTMITYGVNQPISTSVTYTDPASYTTNTVVNMADWIAHKTATSETAMSPE